MHSLETTQVRISVDNEGKLIELKNLQTGTNYAGNGALWRLIYQDGISLEEELHANDITPQIEQTNDTITLHYASEDSSTLCFDLTLKLALTGDDLNIDAELVNTDSERTITECFLPMIHNLQFNEDQELYLTTTGGRRIRNIKEQVQHHHSYYKAQDHYEIQMSTIYPQGAAMNYFTIASENEGLYVGSHDSSFRVTNHYFGKSGDTINAGMIKYPYLHPGESCQLSNFVLSPYTGTWHVAARKYRTWADSWYTPPQIPEEIKEMTSWQRLIMRTQFGKTLFHYRDMPKILADGESAGIKSLFMFGWHYGGHDSEYPDYKCDETQGGKEALREQIAQFQQNGGQVLLYFNGRLIDMATSFYQEKGKALCVKRPNGSENQEFYPFGGKGTALRRFGNKSFVTACPSSREWLDVLKGYVDIAIDLGCAGVFFDQLGTMPALCYDPSHGHKVPFLDCMAVNAENVKTLREYAKSRKPGMSIGIEHITDITSQHADYIHTISPGSGTASDWQHGERPEYNQFTDMYYYTFPEIRISDREIRDDTDIERRVNYALLKGLLSDVEVYRCQATIAETPSYQAYLKQANALREKYSDLLLNGLYRDTDYFELDDEECFATSFTSGNRIAVVITQSHLEQASTIMRIPGYKYAKHDGLGQYTIDAKDDGISISLQRHGLAVIIAEKTS